MQPGTLALAAFTLTAFAANSVFCRLALKPGLIGANEFTLIRLLSGALILLPVLIPGGAAWLKRPGKGTLLQAASLFGYAFFFSRSYVELDAGTGALILFAVVQITMIGAALFQGERLGALQWAGVFLAFAGLTYLLLPGVTAPPPGGAAAMAVAGFFWGAYSLLGRGVASPIAQTGRNFLLTIPFCALLLAVEAPAPDWTAHGAGLAVASGAVSSGIGYVLWYLTLKRITTTVAAVIQLSVPVIAAGGGILLLDESLTLRLASASLVILGGIAITIAGRKRRAAA